MVLRFSLLASTFLFISCTQAERDNPDDPDVINYQENQLSSSSEFVPSSSSGITYGPSVFYEGETYETVVIGTQTWMARNLNYAVEGSKCYNNSEYNCTIYGRLYDRVTALALPSTASVTGNYKGICPSGWHIPSDAEWTTLTNFVGPSAGTKLKANSSLWSTNTGTDTYGFAALPGGYGSSDGDFDIVGNYGLWWSSTGLNSDLDYYWGMAHNNEDVKWINNSKGIILISVRCLLD